MVSRGRIMMLTTHGYVAAQPELGRPDTGGQVVYVLELSRTLARLGYDVDIVTRRFDDQAAEESVAPGVQNSAVCVRRSELHCQGTIASSHRRIHRSPDSPGPRRTKSLTTGLIVIIGMQAWPASRSPNNSRFLIFLRRTRWAFGSGIRPSVSRKS